MPLFLAYTPDLAETQPPIRIDHRRMPRYHKCQLRLVKYQNRDDGIFHGQQS